MTMELKDALELAIKTMEIEATRMKAFGYVSELANLTEAARLLRENKSEPVEHSADVVADKCVQCGATSSKLDTAHCECPILIGGQNFKDVKATQIHTTHNELKIIEVTSEPTFVEIGGSDDK